MMNDMRKVLIDGLEFQIDPEKHYEKDGHVYCKVCHEQLDGQSMEILGRRISTRRTCRCDRERAEKEKAYERMQEVERLKRACFPSSAYSSYTFELCKGDKRKELVIAKNFADNFAKMEEMNVGLLLYGNVGGGKTFLACCIANELMEKKLIGVKMKNFSQIINELQKGGFDMDRNAYINSLVSARLLILDDLGIERDTTYAKEQVYNIVNERYIRKKPTIFTTNLMLKEIADENADVEYRRIYSRITEMCLPVLVNENDHRKTIQQDKKRMAQSILLGGGEK